MMKKKIWLFMAFVALALPAANAQMRLGVKGGLNIATVQFSKDIVNADNVTGFHIGPTIEFGGESPFSLDAALLYSQKGFKYTSLSEIPRQGLDNLNGNVKNSYIEVPINLKYKAGVLPLIKPYVAAGPYFNFNVSGKKLWEMKDAVQTQIQSKSFNVGLNIGAGVEVINTFQVGLTYSWGFTDNYTIKELQIDKTSGKNRMWSLSVAVFL